jgi:alcohol dehydrogenase class IV
MTQIQFGYGARSTLQQAWDRTGITNPLIVTDSGVRCAGIFAVRGGSSIDLAKGVALHDERVHARCVSISKRF